MSARRRRWAATLLAFAALVLVVVPLAFASSSPAKHKLKPKIETEEAGYFGSAMTTHMVSVIVYTNLGPRAGVHVTVCMKGNTCKKAHGHNAKLNWYRADFNTPLMSMSNHVTFTAYASNAAGRTKVTATKPVLCIKNDGSTPQG